MMRMVLASKSPRRKELLGKLYSEFDIVISSADETLDSSVAPVDAVRILAVRKGASVKDLLGNETLIISSDTLVELDGKSLGKPRGKEDAYRMLKGLSGNIHSVHTGVAVHYKGEVFSGVRTSNVKFRDLSDSEIYGYIESGEPFDKAGAYGIQGAAGAFVESFDGDLDTIIGLSLSLTKELVAKAEALG